MKIGYPCINLSINCKGNRTFRLKSYSEQRLIETIEYNLSCLKTVLTYNIEHKLLFFRITSDLIPFASHPVCTFNWQDYFKKEFEIIGKIIKQNHIRISMHPDQFIVLNAKNKNIVNRSINELKYHSEVLELMRLDNTAKIQLHIGGAYGNKNESISRFISNYKILDNSIQQRLVIENDDKLYSFNHCEMVNKKIHIPILFDVFHHVLLNNGESIEKNLEIQTKTWDTSDGIPMVDYSSQKPDAKAGTHTETINTNDFKRFLKLSEPHDFDIMLEIKDKEKSAHKAMEIAKNDKRILRRI